MDGAKKGPKGKNPKTETRNPNETPSPKPQSGVRSPISGFWFWSFVRISGFWFRVLTALQAAGTVMHPVGPIKHAITARFGR
jgi:hypothetical protein